MAVGLVANRKKEVNFIQVVHSMQLKCSVKVLDNTSRLTDIPCNQSESQNKQLRCDEL